MAEDKPVTLAAVIGAHGVTGEVRLKLFGEGLDQISHAMGQAGVAATAIRNALAKKRPLRR